MLDASAREKGAAAASVPELRGAEARGVAEWRRMTGALDKSLRKEMAKLGATPTPRQVSVAARRGRAQFNRNFPAARQEKIFRDQYARTHRVALKVAGPALGKEKRALAAAVDGDRLANAWVNGQRRQLAKVVGQTARDYRRAANASGSKSERARALKDRASVLESRADLNGITSTNQAMARSTRAIYKGAGVERALWITLGDDDVRDEHEQREGQEYDVANGINGEWPGTPPGCRCHSEPVLAPPAQ